MAKNNMKKRRGSEDFCKTNLLNQNKKGQVTVFIIIGILIVGVILLYYFYLGPNWESLTTRKPALEKCIENEMMPIIEELSLGAGIVNSEFNSMYLDENYTFICYTNEYYQPCVVQYPFLKDNFESALSRYMKPIIQECYNDAIDDLRAEGNDVVTGAITSIVNITPDGVKIEIDAPTAISSGGASASFRKFEVNIYSKIYTLIMIANTILQYETSYGDSEVSSFMFYYPDIGVQKIRRDDGVKLYIITDKKDIKYRFATRSYAWPPGYGEL
jgi:hypothetical protein